MSIYLSASMIKDYIACNRRSYYRLNHPELAVETREMTIGTLVHSVIEKHWDNQDNAMRYATQEIEKSFGRDRETFLFVEKCVVNYFENFRSYLSKNDIVEKKFKIPYDKDIFIVGRMDRISNGNVFDWKTERKPKTNVSGEVQFILYDWAYKKLYGYEPSGVYYAGLTNGSLVKYNRDPVSQKALFSGVIPELIDSIKKKDSTPNGVFRSACYLCSYKEACLKEIADVMGSSASS